MKFRYGKGRVVDEVQKEDRRDCKRRLDERRRRLQEYNM